MYFCKIRPGELHRMIVMKSHKR